MKRLNCIIMGLLTAAVLAGASQDVFTVKASKETDIQNQIKEDKNNLSQINQKIDELTDEQDLLEEEIADLNSEIVNMMTSIGLKEDEIASKESEIVNKQADIDQAQLDYEAARQKEEEQYETTKVRIQFMYENNNSSVLTLILESSDISEILNRAQYIEKVYEYDQKLLDEYEATKQQVQDLWNQLETDKAALITDKDQLERDRQQMKDMKAQLDGKLSRKKKESANFDSEIQKYKQEAKVAKTKIQQEEKELKKLKEQQKKPAGNAANGTYKDTGCSSTIDNASGSDLGKKVAKYGCQFIGNPYVMGGTSLTTGADCSGFTYRIYKDFGYNLPRTSYEQRSAGKGITYDQAQPGDLICYDGHVALYIGGGKIVHASSAKTGIKIGTATYRKILAVRRII